MDTHLERGPGLAPVTFTNEGDGKMNWKPQENEWERFFNPVGEDLFDKAVQLQPYIQRQEAEGNCFFRRPVVGPIDRTVKVLNEKTGRTREMIMMGSNSYLGVTTHPRVVAAMKQAADDYGYGTGAVSLFAGTTDLHLKLERRLAEFYQCEAAIVFPTGYAANLGALSGLLRPGDLVVNDMFNHASIYDGCQLSGAEIAVFAHGNMRHLRKVLKKHMTPGRRCLIVTDGVFSMDGDVAKLDEIMEIAAEFGARVMIDEAHAVGVIGPTGRGTAERFGLSGTIDLTIGTLSKAPGAIGGYVTGSRAVVEYLRFYARSYFFSTSIPTPVIAGLIEVFDIFANDHSLHTRLWENVHYVLPKLKEAGFNTGKTSSAVIPIIIGDEDKLKIMNRNLDARGIFMNYVAYPAVAKKRCRLRMNVMANHTRADLDVVVSTLTELGREVGVIT